MDGYLNRLSLCGTIETEPEFDHEVFGERFFSLMLRVPRLSGASDQLPVTVSERLMNEQITVDTRLMITGQLRSYNKLVGGAGRLLLTAFAQQLLAPNDQENANSVTLTGALCKPPAFRTTPFGREICDLMFAVNRAFGKSDYIPCIAWGRTARYAARLAVGERLQVQGRFQSREYQKQMPGGDIVTRVAYEVSLSRLSRVADLMPDMPAEPRQVTIYQ